MVFAQYFIYEMSIDAISKSIILISTTFTAIFFIWSKLFFPILTSLNKGVAYLKDVFTSIDIISKEFQPNHGHSIKDSINRIDSKISIIEMEMNIANENGDKAIFKCNKNGFIFAVNRCYCRMIGCSKEELMGFGWKRFTQKIQENWEGAFEEGREISFDIIMETVDGDVLLLESHCFPVMNSHGDIIHYLGFLRKRGELD